MPELTVIHIALMAITAVIGVVIGWVLRGNRADQEKAAVSAGWQDQIDAQRREGDRLLEQNKGLMEQVSQFQASHTDAKNRAKELSIAVQEAFARRDELQREIKDIRSNLEVAVNERDQLQSDMATRSSEDDIVQQKDARIEKLTQELDNWQNRLPPLIERFRTRNEEAEQLESELEEARERIRELESARENPVEEQTRIEPVTHSDELTDGLDASNDPVDDYADPLVADNDELADEPEDAEPEYEPEPDDDYDDDDDDDDDDDYDDEPVTGTHSLRDDLQQIKGVGPAIEKTLNEMGIFSFQQIAEMSEYDIDRVARRLKGFRSRIYREDWIGQARELRDHAIRA
jgi:predicted flap endonuclease-1-like 5' DNA nuclease/peptidoglycan hydrolase CwlO-like protein